MSMRTSSTRSSESTNPYLSSSPRTRKSVRERMERRPRCSSWPADPRAPAHDAVAAFTLSSRVVQRDFSLCGKNERVTESGQEHEYLTESGQLHQQPTEPRPRRPVAVVVLVATAFIVAVAIGVGTRTLIPSTSDRVTPNVGNPLSSGRTTASNSTSSDINVSRIADTVNPAVVNIDTMLSGGGRAAGTGMVITSSGEILTNNHVIAGATDIMVDFGGTGRTRSARVVGYDVTQDIPLLR